MPPKKRKAIDGGANPPKKAKPTKKAKPDSRLPANCAPNPNRAIEFTVRTIASRTRAARPRIQEIDFTSNIDDISQGHLAIIREGIESAVLADSAKYNGDYLVDGRSRGMTVTLNDPGRDLSVASLAYLISEDGNEYFIASPPVKHSVRRRVHLLIGRNDRSVYVRKLVRSAQKPTEATLWPQTLGQPLRPGLNLNDSAPGAPTFVSCGNLERISMTALLRTRDFQYGV